MASSLRMLRMSVSGMNECQSRCLELQAAILMTLCVHTDAMSADPQKSEIFSNEIDAQIPLNEI